MPSDKRSLMRLGAGSFIASSFLFLVRAILDFVAGTPPSNGLDILAWSASHRTLTAFCNESLFFAVLLLVPALIALYRSFPPARKTMAGTACGIIAVAIPILSFLDIVQARLVYPIFGMSVNTPEVAELTVALFYGGLHAVNIIMGIATIILSLSMRQGIFGRPIVFLGLATGVADIAGAYPSLIGPALTLVRGVFFSAWFAAVGWRLWGAAISLSEV